MKRCRHLLLGALVALAWSVGVCRAAESPAGAPAAPGVVSPPAPAPPAAPPLTPGLGAAPASSASGTPPDASSTPPGSTKPKAEVLIGSIPDLAGVLGGKVEFAKGAFPILADHKEAEVQRMLLVTMPQVCSACGGDGKIGKKDTLVFPPRATHVLPIPLTLNWEDTCSECGGFRNRFDPKWPQRLLFLVDYLAHTARTGNFANLRARVQERLALIGENRKSTVVKHRAEPFSGRYDTTFTDANGRRHSGTAYGVIGLRAVPDQKIPFAVNVPDMVLPLWTVAKDQAPTGQPVVFVARAGQRAEVGGWVWLPMGARTGPHTTSQVLLLCGTPQASDVPGGVSAVGGLLVGRWVPTAGSSDSGALDTSPLPVVMAVASTAISVQTSPASKKSED